MNKARKQELADRINKVKMNESTISKVVDDSREELNGGNEDKYDNEIFIFDHVQNNQKQNGQRPQQVGLIQQKKKINQQVNESMNQSLSISQMSQQKSPREDEQILDYGQQGNQLPNESIRSGDQSFAGDVLDDLSERVVNMNNYDGFPDDFKVSNRLSPLGLSLSPVAFMMTLKYMMYKPYLPFYIILLIIDILTHQSSILLISIYIVIMGLIAPFIWFIVIRSGLQMVHEIDSRLVQKYDFKESRFVEEKRSNLKTGDIIALNTQERCPADMVPLFAIDKYEIRGSYVTLDDQTSCKLLIPQYQINELQQLFMQIKYTELPAFGSVKELTLIHSQGSKFTQTQFSTFTVDDVIPTDQTISLGAIVGMVFMTQMTQLKSGVTGSYSLQNKVAYELKDSININVIASVMIVVSVALSLIGSLLISYIQEDKFLGHQYVQTDSNHKNNLILDNFISHLFIFQNILPVLFEVIKPMFLLIARWKFNNDSVFGGFKYVESSLCRSPSLIDNLSSLKFINYNFKVFNQERLKVCGLFMVSDDDQYSFLPAEPPMNYEELGVITQMEFMLLGIPTGAQDYRLIGAQGYMLKMGGNSILSRNNNKWIVLRSKKYLAQYYLEFTPVVAEEGTVIQLYSIPIKIHSTDTDIIKGKIPAEVAGLTKEEEEEKKQQMLMKVKEYIWVVSCDRNSVFVNQCTTMNFVNSELMIDDNSLFFFYLKMDQDGFNQFISVNGNVNLKSTNIKMNQDYWRILVRKCQPVGCFVYSSVIQQDLSNLLDITKTSIRQWIFSDKMDQKTMDADYTLMHMQKQTKWIELSQSEDVVLKILEVKDLLVKISNLHYFIRNRIIPRQEWIRIHQNPNLLLDDEVFTKAIMETKSLFKNLLLLPSFVIFQGLSAENKQIAIRAQLEAMEEEYVSITVGCESSDLAYVSTGSAMGCLNNHDENLFTDLCQFNFVNLFSLKTLILSHARKTHIRISYFALFQIYKSLVIFSVEMFFFIFYGYSGLSLFPLSLHVVFQLLLTSFYGFSIFLFYQDLNNANEREFGFNFWKCQQKVYFNANRLIMITIIAVFQGFITFYVPSLILQSPTDTTGVIQGFYFISLVSFVTLIGTVNVQPLILFQTLNMEQFISFLINIGWVIVVLNFCTTPGYSTTSEKYIGHLSQLLANLKSLFMVGLLTVINITPVMLIQQYINIKNSVEDENKEVIPEVFDQPKLDKHKYTVRSTNVNSTLNNMMDESKKLQKKKIY